MPRVLFTVLRIAFVASLIPALGGCVFFSNPPREVEPATPVGAPASVARPAAKAVEPAAPEPAAVTPVWVIPVTIEGGVVQMGCGPNDSNCWDDEKPLHEVSVEPFVLDKFEVTNARYQACVAAGACEPPRAVASATHPDYYSNPDFAEFPVVNVDWTQADGFCKWEGKRLPSEAEWEMAARGPDSTRLFPWGDGDFDCTRANGYDKVVNKPCVGDTAKVGSTKSGGSPWGVMDMAGNVYEWVNDLYAADYYASSPGENPAGPETGDARVLRGGSWMSDDGDLRASARYSSVPVLFDNVIGFRCAQSK
jgi:formylglycine-generating enzyme required for sulfatase activity